MDSVSFISGDACPLIVQRGTPGQTSGPEAEHCMPWSMEFRVPLHMVPLKGTGPLTYYYVRMND